MNRDPDAELVTLCQRRSASSLEGDYRRLYDRYKDRVYNVCYRITGNATDALDASLADLTFVATTTTTKKPPPPTIDSFYALPNPAQCDSSLVANITLTFSWTTSHATETKITAFPQTFGPDASTSTAVACGTFDVQYSLMATGPGGTTQNSIQISVVDGRG